MPWVTSWIVSLQRTVGRMSMKSTRRVLGHSLLRLLVRSWERVFCLWNKRVDFIQFQPTVQWVNDNNKIADARWVEWLWHRRLEHWAICCSACLFDGTADSFSSALVALLARSAALVRSFAPELVGQMIFFPPIFKVCGTTVQSDFPLPRHLTRIASASQASKICQRAPGRADPSSRPASNRRCVMTSTPASSIVL